MNGKQLLTALMIALAIGVTCHAVEDHGLKRGDVDLKSAGPLAFGPDGVLFIADVKQATVFAVATGDKSAKAAPVNVSGINTKVAALLGVGPDQAAIEDIAVNPQNGQVYLSVSRGRGPDAQPVILRVGADGKLGEFRLTGVPHASATLPNAPQDKVVGEGRRRANNRLFSITDLAFIDNRVIVAGLSNEEFSSNLRAIPFPFSEVNRGSAIEIYHGAHGKLETHSPVRTFVPIHIGGEPQIVAAYTCTPLVRIPVKDLQPGKKVVGTTVAELGNRNRPLDIIAYKKGGKDFLLMANSARGVMKISTDDIGQRDGIDERISGIAGQPYDTIESLKDVTQLDKLSDTHAVILVQPEGAAADLRTIELP